MTNNNLRCDDPARDAMNKIVGKDGGHLWLIVEWTETRYTPGGYSYTGTVAGGSGGGYYPNAGGGGPNQNTNPETITKKATKKMCQYCGKIEEVKY
ncbi:MAG: hypothetical protein KCHDKBKB_00651 [Elusimicrobia bacterium]|nr:hypothetical protein [Elusimicrobiota bacterium]